MQFDSSGHALGALYWPKRIILGRIDILLFIILCILFGACSAETEEQPAGTEGAEMFNLSIDFQDGFSDDTVVLRIDSEEVARKEQITTSPLLGLATTLQAEVEKGPASVEISIPTRDLQETLLLDIAADKYLGVNNVGGQLGIIISEKPFGYG